MLFLEDIKIEWKSQGFEAKQISFSPTKDSAVVCFKSTRKTKDVICPECGGKVYIHDSFDMTLKDIPLYPGMPLSLFCMGHRYRCCERNKSFTEKIPFISISSKQWSIILCSSGKCDLHRGLCIFRLQQIKGYLLCENAGTMGSDCKFRSNWASECKTAL